MGAKLGKHSSSEQQPKAGSSNDRSASQGSSIIELLKPDCLKAKKMKEKKRQLLPPETKTTKVKKATLEEWLLASPGPELRPDCLTGGELYVFKQFSKRVHPSATKVHQGTYSTPRASFSSDVSSVNGSSMSRSQSGKLRKSVSFKLPEEADIIIFHSPEETLSDQETQVSL